VIIAMRPTGNNPTFAKLLVLNPGYTLRSPKSSLFLFCFFFLNTGTQTLFPEILVYLVGVKSGHWCFSQSSGGDFRMPPRFHQGRKPML